LPKTARNVPIGFSERRGSTSHRRDRGFLLLACGLTCAAAAGSTAFKVAAVLAAAIALYNHWGKRIPVFGPAEYGRCRGLSVLLGATAAPHGELTIPLLLRGRSIPLFVAILLVTLYIAAITHLARYETKHSVPPDANGCRSPHCSSA
jgi:4-hydroxybenzoate polyprenyltransferase